MIANAPIVSRIARNTVFLGIRTVMLMLITLYVSRVVLDLLGVVDYGVYNVVAGVVGLAAFVNSAMMEASKRYAAFSQGASAHSDMRAVFKASCMLHLIAAGVIIVLMETAGLWYVNTCAVIPPDRLIAANVAFQCAMMVFVIQILSMPYEATMIAHECMQLYVYASLVDMVVQLVIVSLLRAANCDRLELYGALLAMEAGVRYVIFCVYCIVRFDECRLTNRTEIKYKPILLEMMAFGSWSMLGHFGEVAKLHGVTLVVNVFCGPIGNAAKGIAYQVTAGVQSLIASFQKALNPLIIKTYARGDMQHTILLTQAGSKYSGMLMLVVCTPLAIRMHYILQLWLVEVPPYAYEFAVLGFVSSLFAAMKAALKTTIQATGNIRMLQVAISCGMLAALPMAYGLLSAGMPAYSVVLASIGAELMVLLTKFWLLHREIAYEVAPMLLNVIGRTVAVATIGISSLLLLDKAVPNDLAGLVLMCVLSVAIYGMAIFLIGMSNRERKYLQLIIQRYTQNDSVN